MGKATGWLTCRIAYVETLRALVLAGGPTGRSARAFRSEWPEMVTVEVDEELCNAAVALSVEDGLRSLDVLHLASALRVSGDDLVLATWDRRLGKAARRHGLNVIGAGA